MKFNKSIIATFVGSALATAALGVAANDNMPAKTFSVERIAQASISNRVATASGMHNQYDAELGKTTFQWAGKQAATPSMGVISVENQNAFAADFYLKQLTGSKPSLAMPVLASIHDTGRGAKIAKYKQEVAGVEVFNREYNIMMDREFNLVASSGYLADKNSARTAASALKNMDSAFGDASTSINAVFADMGGDSASISLIAKESNDKYERFSVANTSTDKVVIGEPRAKKVFFEHKNKLVAAHYVEVETGSIDSLESEYYGYVVAAKTGKVLFKNNLTSHAVDFDYRVYADTAGKPWDSPHGEVMPAPVGTDAGSFLTAEYLDAALVTLSHGAISTSDAWLADDATMTSGNNVTAYVDAIAPQGLTNGDYMAEVTNSNTFDYKYDVSSAEYSVNNRKAAIVNLFYVNNYLHDEYYDRGFDEVSGNAQASNYERGGVEGDALNVEVQDSSGFGNANMSTPADGGSPRMQMYLWETTQAVNGVDFGATVTSHSDIGMITVLQNASFGPEVFRLSGDLVRIEDATVPMNDGCEAATNGVDLVGKIAVIDRGACAFTQKVLNAQAAGAIAVFIVNNNNDGTPAPMGGADDAVTIPSFGLNFSEGAEIYTLLDADETVTVDMFRNDLSRVFKDSTWDNAIVAHEWGHYISNRLVGNGSGLSSQQARSMGEGFGDFHALMLTTEENDNLVLGNETYNGGYGAITYVSSFVEGIRPYPYSTSVTTNPSTFGDIAAYPDQVHAPGSVFSNMLWESFISMANDERHTFDEAKSLIKDYVVAGYKMMPMAPTFTEGRDAILAAAYGNDIEDYKLILAAFAKRGMGLGAVSPSRFSTDHAGAVESYETELSAYSVDSYAVDTNYEGLTSGYCSNDNILDKGETGTVSFTITNNGGEVLTGITGTVMVNSGHDVTFANDGIVTLGDLDLFGSVTSAAIAFTLNDAGTGDELVLKFVPDAVEGVEANDFMFSMTTNIDFETRALVGTSQYEGLNTLSRLHDFTETVMVGGDMATGTWGLDQWDANDGLISSTGHSFTSDVSYETRAMSVGFNGDYTISFWHLYNMEAEWDGAVVEVSVNGGEWADVTAMGGTFEGDGYTDLGLENTEAAIAGRAMFSGINYGVETINFGEILNGNEVQFRFRIATDSAVIPAPFSGFPAGWYIDDMTFSNIGTSIFSDIIAGDTYACENRIPYIAAVSDVEQTVDESGSVSMSVEASDPNSDALTYSWEQTGGSAVTLAGGDTTAVSFTAPSVGVDGETLMFVASVNDGTATVSQNFSVTVNYVPPVITAISDVEQSVDEGSSVSLSVEASDVNGDALTYSWEQTGGSAATLTGGDTAAVSFTAPNVASGSEALTFVASANDGITTVTQSFTVTVNNVPVPTPTPVKKKSSGGSTGLLAFLLLPLALLRRRK